MNHLFHPWLESPEANPRPVGLNDQQHATSRPHFKKLGSIFDTTMMLYCTCKQITLFSLNNFSSWCTPLCSMFTGWGPDKSRSTLSKLENAAFPVLQKKVILVKLPAWPTQGQLAEVSFVHVQCWICCSLILPTLQEGACFPPQLPPAQPPPAAVTAPGAQASAHPCYSFGSSTITLQYLLSRLD